MCLVSGGSFGLVISKLVEENNDDVDNNSCYYSRTGDEEPQICVCCRSVYPPSSFLIALDIQAQLDLANLRCLPP